MAQPVWVLSVDLQTKTATFQTGMAEAARSARSAFKDISSGAADMGDGVQRGSLDVRHALGLVDNTIRGAHSMAMADLIRMFKDSAIVMGALPFAMTVAGFALVAEMVVKGVEAVQAYRQAQEKLREESMKFHTSVQETFDGLNDKILEAQKRSDELANNHLGALRKELELIDHESMSELAHAFATVAKAADNLFGGLKTSWYQMGIGSAGAAHALEDFKVKYESLLAQNKDKDASDLLKGTLDSAKTILILQQQMKTGSSFTPTGNLASDDAEYNRIEAAKNDLKKAGVGWTDKEIQSQQALVDALSAQVEVEQKISTLKKTEDSNARVSTAKEIARDANQEAGKITEGRALLMRDLYEKYKEQVAIVQQGERLTIDATKQGSAERLQAIEDAMAREEADGLQDTAFYKQLSIEKLSVQNEMSQRAATQAAAMGREQADNAEKMGELAIAAEKQRMDLINSGRRVSADEQTAQEKQLADETYRIKRESIFNEIAALDEGGNEYLAKLQQLQDKEAQLTQAHENQITAIKEKAEEQRNQRIMSAESQVFNSMADNLTRSITGHQTWSKMILSMGDEAVSGMIKNSMLILLQQDKERLGDARTAAGNVYSSISAIPIIGPFIAPVAAAGAFAAVMAFESGTDRVPGVGRGDIVPTMLEPGEGVVPGGVMDGLRHIAQHGGFNQRPSISIYPHFAPHIHAMDAEGVDRVLTEHGDRFQAHFENVLRKANR